MSDRVTGWGVDSTVMNCPECSRPMAKSFAIKVCFGPESDERPYFWHCECGVAITNTGDKIKINNEKH